LVQCAIADDRRPGRERAQALDVGLAGNQRHVLPAVTFDAAEEAEGIGLRHVERVTAAPD
jgi:hypothetical protein